MNGNALWLAGADSWICNRLLPISLGCFAPRAQPSCQPLLRFSRTPAKVPLPRATAARHLPDLARPFLDRPWIHNATGKQASAMAVAMVPRER